MSSNSSSKLYECHCDECTVFSKSGYVAYSKMRYHRKRKLFNGMKFEEWKKTSEGYTILKKARTICHEQNDSNKDAVVTAVEQELADSTCQEEFSIVDEQESLLPAFNDFDVDCGANDFDAGQLSSETLVNNSHSDALLESGTSQQLTSFSDKAIRSLSPSAEILSMMITLLNNRNIARKDSEMIMECLNYVLKLNNDPFQFPKSMATFLKRNDLTTYSHEGIRYYAVCSDCHKLSLLKENPSEEDMMCDADLTKAAFVPQRQNPFCMGKMYEYQHNAKESKLIPLKEYAYCSLVTILKKFFLRQGFAERVKAWKERTIIQGYMTDFYDATNFTSFKALPTDALPFVLGSDYNLMLTLNIDWFGPYKAIYSVGCIYLTIQNLGKADGRDQKENMLFVGAIPGPKEPSTTAINHYLEPLVDELLVLLKGVEMKMLMKDGSIQINKVKACLATISSDLPATKKLACAMSYSSKAGCHLCKTRFETLPGHKNHLDYCHWDCDSWVKRNTEETRASSRAWKQAKTAKAREDLEKVTGVRYSVLFRLPYFSYDLIAIEPMHALYLGIVKKALLDMVPDKGFEKIQFQLQIKFAYSHQASGKSIAGKITNTGFANIKAVELKDFMSTMASNVLRPLFADAKEENGQAKYNTMKHLIAALRLFRQTL